MKVKDIIWIIDTDSVFGLRFDIHMNGYLGETMMKKSQVVKKYGNNVVEKIIPVDAGTVMLVLEDK